MDFMVILAQGFHILKDGSDWALVIDSLLYQKLAFESYDPSLLNHLPIEPPPVYFLDAMLDPWLNPTNTY